MRILTLLLLTAALHAQPSLLTIREIDAGSVAIKLDSTNIVNKDSSLHLRWLPINDASCPVQLGDFGLRIRYRGSRGFLFGIAGQAAATQDIAAAEIVMVLYDLWGRYIRTLSYLTISPARQGAELSLDGTEWVEDHDSERFMTTVSYVDHVRLANGKIWKANLPAVLAKVNTAELKLSEAQLAPSTPGK